jgi:hypothetical protein
VEGCSLDVVSSEPPNNAIDSRQPSNLDGSDPVGWDTVKLSFDDDASCIGVKDFVVTVSPADTPAPTVVDVVPSGGGGATLTLDFRIPPGHWTQITHNDDSPTSVCLGFLPADTDASRQSNPQDILRIIDCLNKVAICADYQLDIDRSGAGNAQDILRIIDLLNGADEFNTWNTASVGPSPCD